MPTKGRPLFGPKPDRVHRPSSQCKGGNGTAKIEVTGHLLAELLFKGASSPVFITGATFDPQSGVVTFDIEGVCVPDAERVTVVTTQTFCRTEFRALSAVQGE